MNPYAQSADAYLAQRVLHAGPVQQAALLMEAGQRFLGKAATAIEQKNFTEMGRCLRLVTEIINEALCRLNYEDGGELVDNLSKVYDKWTEMVFEASKSYDVARLRIVAGQMGEIRQAWEQLAEKQAAELQNSELHLGDRVI